MPLQPGATSLKATFRAVSSGYGGQSPFAPAFLVNCISEGVPDSDALPAEDEGKISGGGCGCCLERAAPGAIWIALAGALH